MSPGSQQLIEDLTPYLIGWRGYFGFCQTPRVLTNLRRGFAEDYARIFGGSGRTGTTASMNCAIVAYRSSMRRSPPVRRPVSGACPDIRRSNRPCATTISTHSVSPDSMSRSRLNPVEPPWYATRMPGGVGGVAPRGVPLSRSSAQLRRPHTLRRRTETLHQSPEVQK